MPRMTLDALQPSQLYISSAKLAQVVQALDAGEPSAHEPLPVKQLGGHTVLTDGHTRALAAFLRGEAEIVVAWDEDDLDWEAYEICVRWCREEGIRGIGDLQGRVIGPAEYDELWLARCRRMHEELLRKRREG